jgi:lysophospholipase L1-like esterase
MRSPTDHDPTRPLRLTVLGNSQAVMLSPRGGPRTDRTFAQWLHRFSTRLGTPIEVTNMSVEVADVRHSLTLLPAMLRHPAPDVVLVQVGTAEAFSICTPHWLWHLFLGSERHAGLARRVFERLRPQLWPVLRGYQRAVDRRLGPLGGRVSPRRFERHLRRLLRQLRRETGALLLVADVVALERIAQNTPSAPQRLRRIQSTLLQTVESLRDPDIRVIPFSKIVEAEFGIGDGMPDGYHFSAAVHRRVAEELWRSVCGWEEEHRGVAVDGDDDPAERSVPLRVVVIGGSEASFASHDGASHGAPTCVDLLAGATTTTGTDLEVFTCTSPGADVRLAIDAFQPAIQQVGPDVVVIEASGSPRISPARAERELRIAVALARRVSSPLVLILDTPAPPRDGRGRRRQRDRRTELNRRIAAVTADGTGEVRLLSLAAIVAQMGLAAAYADGGHLSPEAHRRLARCIVEQISAWERSTPL